MDFKEKNFWENDIIIFIGIKLIIQSKQEKPKWLIKYCDKVLIKTLEIMPSGATVLYLYEYFNKLYKRTYFTKFIKRVIDENKLESGGSYSSIEIDNMLNTNFSRFSNSSLEKKVILDFYNKLLFILDNK